MYNEILNLFPKISIGDAGKFFNNNNTLLINVINYIYELDCNTTIYEHAPCDNFTNNEVMITSYDYNYELDVFLDDNNIDLGYEDEYVSSDNYAYYLHDYHMGYNFIVGDGYIIGEDDVDCISYDDILSALLSGNKEDVYFLPYNGNLWDEIVLSGAGHKVDLSPIEKYETRYHEHEINSFIDRMNNKKKMVISISNSNIFYVINAQKIYNILGVNL